jgi:hypothetical protein
LLYEELSRILILSCTRLAEGQFKYICAVHHANQPDQSQFSSSRPVYSRLTPVLALVSLSYPALTFSLTDVVAPEGNEGTKDEWYLYTPVDRSSFSDEQLKYFHTQFRFPKQQALDLTLQMLELLDYKLYGDGEDDSTADNGDDDEIQELSRA